jgi:hypothetical protein
MSTTGNSTVGNNQLFYHFLHLIIFKILSLGTFFFAPYLWLLVELLFMFWRFPKLKDQAQNGRASGPNQVPGAQHAKVQIQKGYRNKVNSEIWNNAAIKF